MATHHQFVRAKEYDCVLNDADAAREIRENCDVWYQTQYGALRGFRFAELERQLRLHDVVTVVSNFDAIAELKRRFASAVAVWMERDADPATDEYYRSERESLLLDEAKGRLVYHDVESTFPSYANLFDFVISSAESRDGQFRQIDGFMAVLNTPVRAELYNASGSILRLSSLRQVLATSSSIQQLLLSDPAELFSLTPRQFEELIAVLFEREGYDVQLTPATRDGGYDIVAVRKDIVVPQVVLVECKRYASSRAVGIQPVRQLYGVLSMHEANAALLVTTSRFTREAQSFARSVGYRLTLRDYDAIVRWLSSFGKESRGLTLV